MHRIVILYTIHIITPQALKYADGFPVINDFNRIMTTMFNGASNVAQAGGLACLEGEGYKAMLELVAFYKENAKLLRQAFVDMGFKVKTKMYGVYV
jgi:LL-diaminopimelate aminotransferase